MTASFSHLDLMHLVFNMGSLYTCGAAERIGGSMYYLQNTVLLIVSPASGGFVMRCMCVTKVLVLVVGIQVLSSAITMGMYHVLLHRFGLQQ